VTDFEKFSNTKFHKNQSSGGRVVPCGRRNGQTDMTKLMVALSVLQKRLKMYL